MQELDRSKLNDHDLLISLHVGLEQLSRDVKEVKDGTSQTLAELKINKVDKEEYNRHVKETQDYKKDLEVILKSQETRVSTLEDKGSRLTGALVVLNVILGIAVPVILFLLK